MNDLERAVKYFQDGINNDIFSEQLTHHAKVAIDALKSQLPVNNEKCDCYHEREGVFYTYNQITGAPICHLNTIGECWGTKERDQCNCGGDRSKCTFYKNET